MHAVQHSSDSTGNAQPETWVEVWRAGLLVFGDRWTLAHGDRPTGEWLNVFESLNIAQLRAGVYRMKKDAEARIKAGDEAWPPIPFEFHCLCKTNSSLYFADSQAALPPPRANKHYAQIQLLNIRSILRKARTDNILKPRHLRDDDERYGDDERAAIQAE